jgi:hypothetical protein
VVSRRAENLGRAYESRRTYLVLGFHGEGIKSANLGENSSAQFRIAILQSYTFSYSVRTQPYVVRFWRVCEVVHFFVHCTYTAVHSKIWHPKPQIRTLSPVLGYRGVYDLLVAHSVGFVICGLFGWPPLAWRPSNSHRLSVA